MNNLTIFANFFIDSEERFIRMKDSFCSMNKIECESYLVNVRGSYSREVVNFLISSKKKLEIYLLESEQGWFYDTEKIEENIKTQYVLLWLEDQICMDPISINKIVKEMQCVNADILTYTYWANGKYLERYASVKQIQGNNITWFDHDVHENKKLNKNSKSKRSYLVSYPSIMKTTLFRKLIINGGGSGPYPITTPFNFEKPPEDIEWLPLRRASPKVELFAPIDDDHCHPGSSLQSRGMYPKRVGRHSYAQDSSSNLSKITRKIRSKLKHFENFILFIKVLFSIPKNFKINYINSILLGTKRIELSNFNYYLISYLTNNIHIGMKVLEIGSIKNYTFWKKKRIKTSFIIINKIEQDDYLLNLKFENIIVAEPKPIQINKNNNIHYFNNCNEKLKGYDFSRFIQAIDKITDEELDLIITYPNINFLLEELNLILKILNKLKIGGKLVINNLNPKKINDIKNFIPNRYKIITYLGVAPGSLSKLHTLIVIKNI